MREPQECIHCHLPPNRHVGGKHCLDPNSGRFTGTVYTHIVDPNEGDDGLTLRVIETQEEIDDRRRVYAKYPRAYQDGKGSIWTDDFYTCDSHSLSAIENVLDLDL